MMTEATGLEHIKEGYAYKSGEARQLYSVNDPTSVEATLFAKCIDYGIGPLNIHACLDTTGPSVSLEVTLLGVKIASCELSPDHRDCKIGGSVDGFKAELDVTFSITPLQISIEVQLCAPLAGCKTFPVTIPL